MAEPQRLLLPPVGAPTVQVETDDYHTPQFASLSASLLWSGDRRLQAETYMASGYGTRLAIESQRQGWTAFGEVARISQPPRTKAVLVSSQHGTPFLVAGQMFSIRPQARKWLAIEKLAHSEQLFVESGDILVRRSADVGRATLALQAHENHLISDHFLRIEAIDDSQKGWIYAFIRSPQGRSMMKSAKYGHIIQHIEISHLRELPIPTVADSIAADLNARVEQILDARNQGHRLSLEAEARFERSIGPVDVRDAEVGFSVSSLAFS